MRPLVVALALTLAASVSAAAPDCPRWRSALLQMPTRTMVIEVDGATQRVPVKLARDGEQQAAGFQCATRREIEQTLILFDFGTEIMTAFHMQNVVAPLDIAFAKADGRVFAVQRMAPSPTTLYQPLGAFRYALEARAGFLEQAGIRAGSARIVLAP